jgi:ABC-type polysaccharide/polyol phosphate export permease
MERDTTSGWLGAVARVNPVTYLLGGLRSLVLDHGVQWAKLSQAVVAIALVGLISMTLCFAALRVRIERG